MIFLTSSLFNKVGLVFYILEGGWGVRFNHKGKGENEKNCLGGGLNAF